MTRISHTGSTCFRYTKALVVPVGILLIAAARAAEPPPSGLLRLFYDFEVASYCGLVDSKTASGFQRESRRLVRELALPNHELSEIRGYAWQLANAEWQNRGLGGFRGWCRKEGMEAAERFAESAVNEAM